MSFFDENKIALSVCFEKMMYIGRYGVKQYLINI